MLKYNFSTFESSKKCNLSNFIANFKAFALDFEDYQQISAKVLF